MSEKSSLRLTLDFQLGASDLEKARGALDASIAFKKLTEAVTKDIGAAGKVEWTYSRMEFDGEDASAQPIFDALLAAYEKGRGDA